VTPSPGLRQPSPRKRGEGFHHLRKGVCERGQVHYSIPAKIPAYAVLDFVSDWQLTPWLKLLAGTSNLTDRQYYNRVWQTGLEPAYGRTWCAGFELKM